MALTDPQIKARINVQVSTTKRRATESLIVRHALRRFIAHKCAHNAIQQWGRGWLTSINDRCVQNHVFNRLGLIESSEARKCCERSALCHLSCASEKGFFSSAYNLLYHLFIATVILCFTRTRTHGLFEMTLTTAIRYPPANLAKTCTHRVCHPHAILDDCPDFDGYPATGGRVVDESVACLANRNQK